MPPPKYSTVTDAQDARDVQIIQLLQNKIVQNKLNILHNVLCAALWQNKDVYS